MPLCRVDYHPCTPPVKHAKRDKGGAQRQRGRDSIARVVVDVVVEEHGKAYPQYGRAHYDLYGGDVGEELGLALPCVNDVLRDDAHDARDSDVKQQPQPYGSQERRDEERKRREHRDDLLLRVAAVRRHICKRDRKDVAYRRKADVVSLHHVFDCHAKDQAAKEGYKQHHLGQLPQRKAGPAHPEFRVAGHPGLGLVLAPLQKVDDGPDAVPGYRVARLEVQADKRNSCEDKP